MPEPQLMTTRLMIRLNSIRIFSKVGNLGRGYILDLASRGWGIFQAKEKATLFRGRLYYYITYSIVPSVSYSL
jgi:hypothetical protein